MYENYAVLDSQEMPTQSSAINTIMPLGSALKKPVILWNLNGKNVLDMFTIVFSFKNYVSVYMSAGVSFMCVQMPSESRREYFLELESQFIQ